MTRQVLMFSGGKDSLVAGHSLDVKEAVYCKTGIGLNFDYVLKTCEKLGWKLHVIFPKKGESFEDFVRKFGFPHQGMHSAIFGYLKWHPLRTWYKQQKDKEIVLISGRRKNESARRKRMKSNKEYDETEGMKFYSPLYYWSELQVLDYVKKHELELSPIYETMHMGGDDFCGAFAQKGEAQLLYTFHKELADRFIALEKMYGGKWGNYTSMEGITKQSKLDELICTECIYQ